MSTSRGSSKDGGSHKKDRNEQVIERSFREVIGWLKVNWNCKEDIRTVFPKAMKKIDQWTKNNSIVPPVAAIIHENIDSVTSSQNIIISPQSEEQVLTLSQQLPKRNRVQPQRRSRESGMYNSENNLCAYNATMQIFCWILNPIHFIDHQKHLSKAISQIMIAFDTGQTVDGQAAYNIIRSGIDDFAERRQVDIGELIAHFLQLLHKKWYKLKHY